jgi:hypothetical protein
MRKILLLVSALALAGAAPAAHASPSNDNLDDATVISTLPFHADVNLADATLEPNEPAICGSGNASIWFRYDAPTTGGLSVSMKDTDGISGEMTVFEGKPTDSSWTGCGYSQDVVAGKTYYFQLFGETDGFSAASLFTFDIAVLPNADLATTSINVETIVTPTPLGGARTGTTKHIEATFANLGDEHVAASIYMVVCPLGVVRGCRTLASGRIELGPNESYTRSVTWQATGVGEYAVGAGVWPESRHEMSPVNNYRRAYAYSGAALPIGVDVGCAAWPLAPCV